jgi:amino acid adenylation domain-containing protein
MIVALLGILKAGAAYLPLNFEHPAARLSHQLVETGAAAVVTQEMLLHRLPTFAGEVVCVDRDRAELDREPETAPDCAASPDDLAYVIYTSGSTGTPKGVGVTNANLANYVQAIQRQLGADGEPLAFGMVSAISTDLGNTAVFPSLCSGGTLVLVSPAAAADGAAASAFLQAHPVDVLKITPSHLNALLVGADAAGVLPRRWLIVGGEALSWDLVARVRELGECRILNHFGPTETTIGSCTFALDDGSERASATVPIGFPIANTSCYVLDEKGQCVPEGVPGELFISGAGVALGYVGQPDLTEEHFRPDPFGDGRMYATGDLVRRLSDGALEFLGRRDDQIKIRGFRVEPAEIESALRAFDRVRQAAVVAREDGRGERRLVAYVTLSSQATGEQLRAHLADLIPDYMIPSGFVVVDSLPLTPSGKIDRLALPDPESVNGASATAYVAPRTPVEESVAAIWADVLGLERVGAEDDFFALGGHSLLATQIVAQVRSDFSINLPLHALFTSPTVATLSQQIVELLGQAPDADTEKLLAELESLSDEEVALLLAAEAPPELPAP